MKYAIPIVIAIVAVSMTALFVAIWSLPDGRTTDGNSRDAGLPASAGATWTMPRGDQAKRAVAPGSLPDAMRVYWRFKTEGTVSSAAVVADGRVFFASEDGNAYAVGLIDGKKIWSFSTDDAISASPIVLDGFVYVASNDGKLYCLDAASGADKWAFDVEGTVWGSPNWVLSPDGRSKWVIVVNEHGGVYAIDAVTGKQAWRQDLDSQVRAGPVLVDSLLLMGACDSGEVKIVRARDGEIVAGIDVDGKVAAPMAAAGGMVLAGTLGGNFLGVDVKSGQIVWQYDKAQDNIWSAPASDGQRVVFGADDNQVHCLDVETGDPFWVFPTRRAVRGSPVICGDKVVVGSDDGRLYLLRLDDGTVLWSYQIGAPVTAPPIVAGGCVIVGCDDGYVYAFGAQ